MNQPEVRTIVVQNAPSPGLAAVLSFFVPGLGQLYRGQIFYAGFVFVACLVLYCLVLTIPFAMLLHLAAVVDAGRR